MMDPREKVSVVVLNPLAPASTIALLATPQFAIYDLLLYLETSGQPGNKGHQ
jgi:hypothetical protein